MAEFTVETPNAEYSGKTMGVRFDGGVARVNENTVPKALGRSPKEVAGLMAQEAGYAVTDSHGARVFTVPPMPWKESSPQPSPIGEGVTPTPTPPPSATGEGDKKKAGGK